MDANRNGRYTKHDWVDAITIQENSIYFSTGNTCRSQRLRDNKEYLDLHGEYFKILNIDTLGRFIQLQKVDSINRNSSLYLDNYVRNNVFVNSDTVFHIHDYLHQDKLVLIDLWSEFTPSFTDDLQIFNELQKKYKDDFIVLGLLDSKKQEDLDRLVKWHKITYQVGLSNIDVNQDLVKNGSPYKSLISPSGKFIKRRIKTSEVEKYLLEFKKNKRMKLDK